MFSLLYCKLGFKTETEFDIEGLKYDVHVVGTNVTIEYNGKWWHSFIGSEERDARKLQNAIDNGYKMYTINENDWKEYKLEIQNQIAQLLI